MNRLFWLLGLSITVVSCSEPQRVIGAKSSRVYASRAEQFIEVLRSQFVREAEPLIAEGLEVASVDLDGPILQWAEVTCPRSLVHLT